MIIVNYYEKTCNDIPHLATYTCFPTSPRANKENIRTEFAGFVDLNKKNYRKAKIKKFTGFNKRSLH